MTSRSGTVSVPWKSGPLRWKFPLSDRISVENECLFFRKCSPWTRITRKECLPYWGLSVLKIRHGESQYQKCHNRITELAVFCRENQKQTTGRHCRWTFKEPPERSKTCEAQQCGLAWLFQGSFQTCSETQNASWKGTVLPKSIKPIFHAKLSIDLQQEESHSILQAFKAHFRAFSKWKAIRPNQCHCF